MLGILAVSSAAGSIGYYLYQEQLSDIKRQITGEKEVTWTQWLMRLLGLTKVKRSAIS